HNNCPPDLKLTTLCRVAGAASGLSCGDILRCQAGCGANAACQAACVASGSDQGRADLTARNACIAANCAGLTGDPLSACIVANCALEQSRCLEPSDAAQCELDAFCDGVADHCPPNLPRPAGSACNDGNACTQSDACDGAGACVGSNP